MKFSFAVLTWNRNEFLLRCITALVESLGDLRDFEVLIMDNGSDDGTAEFLDNYAADPRFRIFKLKKNYGLNSYKKLFGKAKGEFIIEIDDDVIGFPFGFAATFEEYLKAFPDFGYVALDVIQNEFTNGAKPPDDLYTDVERNGKTIQEGPTGGWCVCFRRKDYRKVKWLFYLKNLDMKQSEDGILSGLFQKLLGLRSGLIKGVKCFHACGPHFSREFGYLERDIEKYAAAGLDEMRSLYASYRRDEG